MKIEQNVGQLKQIPAGFTNNKIKKQEYKKLRM